MKPIEMSNSLLSHAFIAAWIASGTLALLSPKLISPRLAERWLECV